MQTSTVSGESSLRLNTQSRSLWITFPRAIPDKNVLVILYDHLRGNRKYNLHVVTADAKGIEVRIPHVLTGIYNLKIKDGRHAFMRQVAIQ
jgi:hypothetical protein